MPVYKPAANTVALLVATSMAATPALAADLSQLPIPAPQEYAPMEANVDEGSEYHRRYRYRRHRHRVGAGDVLAGVLIIGGIAAIASAANNNNRDRRYRDRDYRYRDRDSRYRDRDYDYRDRRNTRRNSDARGIDGAVSMCLREIERDVRVDQVDEVNRTGEGWNVRGRLYNGERFSCSIDGDGRIDGINYGSGRSDAAVAPVEDNQWSDDRYAQARERMERQAAAPQAQPAYPGGPLPGEEIDGDMAQTNGADDRYQTHTAPDFSEA